MEILLKDGTLMDSILLVLETDLLLSFWRLQSEELQR
jgi:hypothetical protein